MCIRDRDGASALPRVPRRRRAVLPRGGDRAALLPGQLRRRPAAVGGRRGLLRADARRRLGLGRVPVGAFRQERQGRHLQGRQRRGAAAQGARGAEAASLSTWRWCPVRATQAVGRYGERVAVDRLERAGMRVLDRNWRCEEGELDIVALDGGCVVAVEVKTRRSLACGHPFDAVTPVKARRLLVLPPPPLSL